MYPINHMSINRQLVSWCFEPSQLLGVTSGLNMIDQQAKVTTYMSPEQVNVGPKSSVCVTDVLHHILYGPLAGL